MQLGKKDDCENLVMDVIKDIATVDLYRSIYKRLECYIIDRSNQTSSDTFV